MYSPGIPMRVSVSESQIPRKKGYARKTPSRVSPGSIKITPRELSRSRRLLKRRGTELMGRRGVLQERELEGIKKPPGQGAAQRVLECYAWDVAQR
jgi:hypothetical protein